MPRGEGPGMAAWPLQTPTPAASVIPPTPATASQGQSFTPNYQTLTGAQMASLGYGYGGDWWTQNAGVFNPTGEFTTPEQYQAFYGGSPVATGYSGASGTWTVNAMPGTYQAGKMRTMQFPNLSPITSASSYQGLQGLIQTLQVGPNFPGAASYAAGIMGTTPEQYQQTMGGLMGQLGKGVSGQEGLPKEQQDLMNRQLQWQIDDSRENMREIVGALAGSGRSIQAFQQMDEIASQIRDTYAQGKLTQWNLNMAQQKLQYDAAMQQYNMMSNLGLQGADQFLNNIRANQESQLQAYATDISTLAQQNQVDIQAFQAHADTYYKSFMVDLGLDEAAMNKTYEQYSQWLTPILDQLTIAIQEQIKNYIPQLFQ